MATMDFLQSIKSSGVKAIPIPVDDIVPDPDQPRQVFHAVDGMIPAEEMEQLEFLASSIAKDGLDQPITVREIAANKYMIIMGERRWRAMRMNKERGLPDSETILAFVKNGLSDTQRRLKQLRENHQRKNLSDLETANFIKRMMEDDPSLQKQDIAKELDMKRSEVSRYLALLDHRWANVVETGLITYASVLEYFKSLPEDSRNSLVKKAQNEGRSITAQDVRKAKADLRPTASTQVRPSGESAGLVDSSLAADVQELLGKNSPKGENYKPSEALQKMKPKAPGIKDTGGDAVIPPGPASLAPSLLEKREVKITLEQLVRLVKYEAQGDMSKVTSLLMPVAEIREAILALGGKLPEDDSLLVMELIKALNTAG